MTHGHPQSVIYALAESIVVDVLRGEAREGRGGTCVDRLEASVR